MENNFLSGYSGAGDASSSSFDPMFSGVSLQSILSLNPSVFSDYSAAAGLPTLPYLPDDSLSLNLGEVTQASNIVDHFAETKEKKPMVPKSEPCLFEDVLTSASGTTSHPLDFFSTNCPSNFYVSSTFQLLPELHSMESFSHKRRRFDTPISGPNNMAEQTNHYLHPATLNNSLFAVTPPFNGKPASSSVDAPVGEKSSPVIPQSNLARQRRHKLSDKTRCLQKLMPWDKKMDQATLLEEAYKYVKFLQAQFRALQSMSSDSPSFLPHNGTSPPALPNGDVFGDLERLNRSQLLQVLVNSPVAQTMLYSQGFCVFSLEQLTLLKDISSRRLLLQQMMSDKASSKAFFN